MAREHVHCTGHSDLSADRLWTRVREFAEPWHPLVDWMAPEDRPDGRFVRRFATKDDPTLMREELTYFSDSDRNYAYRALDGIAGAEGYEARLEIDDGPGGTTVTWQVEIDAPKTRAKEIATGTRQVFETGLAEIAGFTNATKINTPSFPAKTPIEARQIGPLGISVAPVGLQQAETIAIYLHGIGGNRDNWHAQLAALGGQVPSVALDLRGYGDSAPGPDQSTVEAYGQDIRTVMTAFKARQVILCGLSYGAWIAVSFALRHPDLIAGLILCGGCTGMSEAAPAECEAFRLSRLVPLDGGQTPADFAPDVVDVIAGPTATSDMRAALHRSMASIPVDTYLDALNCFCNPLEKLDLGVASFPTLLITGEHDRLAPPGEIRAISHRFHQAGAPFVRFEMIAVAGHVCNVEAPERVNTVLMEFIARLTRPTLTQAQTQTSKSAKQAEKRRRILNAALHEFSRNGFSGASMQAIAKSAGVSKPTLYQYIGQKDALFRAVLERGRAEILAPLADAHSRGMVHVLWAFSWAYADFVLHPDNLSVARLVIGEAERVPEIARQFHETGPAQALAGIAAYLLTRRDAGELRFVDAEQAADHLWSLILSGPRNHALHFPGDGPNGAELHTSILAGLRVFLRAYASDPDTALAALERVRADDAT